MIFHIKNEKVRSKVKRINNDNKRMRKCGKSRCQYLDSKSCQPSHVKKGIPYEQALRVNLRRNLKVISLREVLRRI